MTWLKTISTLSTLKSLVTRKVEVSYVEPTNLVRGKWVSSGELVGIVTDLSTGGVVGIDIVDSEGNTLRHEKVPSSSVLLAKWEQIPEWRRSFSREYATQLGYN